MPQQVDPPLLKPVAEKGHRPANILDVEGQGLIRFPLAPGSQCAALMQIGHGKMGLQMGTRVSFKRRQIQAAAGTAVKIEKRRAVLSALDADMEAQTVGGRDKVGFEKLTLHR